MSSAVLEIEGLSARYGEAQALRDVSLHVGEGELVTLVGRNGAGKTTLLRCVMGLHRQSTGSTRLSIGPSVWVPPRTDWSRYSPFARWSERSVAERTSSGGRSGVTSRTATKRSSPSSQC